jgi:hypothetical protein
MDVADLPRPVGYRLGVCGVDVENRAPEGPETKRVIRTPADDHLPE